MKKIFTLLTLALVSIGTANAQITTKTWDFTAITSGEITALTTDVDTDHKATFSSTTSSGTTYLSNVAAGTSTSGAVNYIVKDPNGNEIATTEGLIWGRNGDVIKASAFRFYTAGSTLGIYFNYKRGIVRLPSIKAGQEVIVTTSSYTSTVSVTNTDDTPSVVNNEFSFFVKADGTVDIEFAEKPYIKKIIVQNPTPKHTVTYSLGAATGGTAPTQAAVKEGATFTVASAPGDLEAPSGKEFKCWNDGTTDYNAGATYTMGTSNVTLTAVYQDITVKYTITYDLGAATAGTAPTQASLAEGATFNVAAVPGDLVAPSGKEFKCWNDGTTDYNPGATYTMGTSNVTLTAVYQDKTYHGLTPTSTMDFDNPGTMFTSVWTTGNNLTQNFYFDAPNGVAVFSAFALYQAKNNSKISWMITDNASSTDDTWSATGSFKGNSYYFGSSPKTATVRSTSRMHYYRVKGITSASALMGGKAKMDAYLVTAGVVSADPVAENSINAAGTLSITGLVAANEYIIKVYGDNGNSNVQFREIAFTFTPVTSVSATIDGTYEWATFVSPYALDFSSVSGLKAYIVTGHEGNAITKAQMTGTVPAGTPLLLNGATASIPVVASSTTDVSSNLLKTGAVAVESGKTKYVLSVEGGAAQFKKVTSAISASDMTGKAYLEFNEVIAAREFLSIDGDATAIKNIKVGTEDNIYYDLNGRRVLYPTKGLYIVNGRKVVIK